MKLMRRNDIYISYEVEKKIIRGSSFRIPLKPFGDKEAGVDIGVNNLLAIYVDDGSALLVNGRPLKAISFYWREKISGYQSILNRYGFKSSKRLRRMYKRWRKQIKSYIDWAVRNTIEWLYNEGVKRIFVGHPKYASQEPNKGSKVNFEIVHIWSYGYLLRD
ncbi:MAG: transposase [Sulfolobales archaeon]